MDRAIQASLTARFFRFWVGAMQEIEFGLTAERLVEVLDQILGVLESDRDSDQ
jgi:hypothetical protein